MVGQAVTTSIVFARIRLSAVIALGFLAMLNCGRSTANKGSSTRMPERVPARIFYVINMNISADSVASARRIADAVQGLTGVPAVIEHYRYASYDRAAELKPVGIILSGQSSPWEDYPKQALKPAMDMVRRSESPILGICGGHQFIALAFGGKVDRIKRLHPGRGYSGCYRERGFTKIKVDKDDLLLGPRGRGLTVYESHCDEVKKLPSGFERCASNTTSPIQAMKHRARDIYGVQFHPEIYSGSWSDGKRVLTKFLNLCLSKRASRDHSREGSSRDLKIKTKAGD